jgi:PAS domain S-box-containing protein
MSPAVHAYTDQPSLRQRALTQLTSSLRTDLRRASTSEAMAVLHQLASSPETAGDALALLHELQVHQVEIDLQQEELRESRAELESTLARQIALIEHAPVGYLTVDSRTVLCEINLTGARLLGAARDELIGQPLASFLSAEGADTLHALLAHAGDDLSAKTCQLRLKPVTGVAIDLHATASVDNVPARFLLVVMVAASSGQASAG